MKLLSDRLKDNCKRDYDFAANFIAQKYVAYIALKRTFLIKSVYNYYTKRYQRPLSPPERGYKAVLEYEFHAVEFGFQTLDSGFFVSGNRLRDSGFH